MDPSERHFRLQLAMDNLELIEAELAEAKKFPSVDAEVQRLIALRDEAARKVDDVYADIGGEG